jgi:hypothetical protein
VVAFVRTQLFSVAELRFIAQLRTIAELQLAQLRAIEELHGSARILARLLRP